MEVYGSFTPRLLYSPYPVNRRLGRLHSRSGHFWRTEKWNPATRRSIHSLATVTFKHPLVILYKVWSTEQSVTKSFFLLFRDLVCFTTRFGQLGLLQLIQLCMEYVEGNYQHTVLQIFIIYYNILYIWGTRWRSWLRHCSTSRKVAGSIPERVIGIFRWHNPFGRTIALGSTQPLTEMSTRNTSWGVKAAGA
jgi:hypothetical protein